MSLWVGAQKGKFFRTPLTYKGLPQGRTYSQCGVRLIIHSEHEKKVKDCWMERVRKKEAINRRRKEENETKTKRAPAPRIRQSGFTTIFFQISERAKGLPRRKRFPRKEERLFFFSLPFTTKIDTASSPSRRHYTKSRIYLNLSRDAARETRDRRRERKVLVERNRERERTLVKTAKSID